MIDKIRDGIGIKAVGLISRLDYNDINGIYDGHIPKKLLGKIKAAGISLENPLEMEILRQHAMFRLKLDDSPLFSIIELDDRYVISPIKCRGKLYEVDWSKELLDNGNFHKQDEWVELLNGSEWSLPSGPLCHAAIDTVFRNRDGKHSKLIQKFREMLKKDFKDYFMITGTRIKYQPQGIDNVIHDYGSHDESQLDADIVGPDRLVNAQCSFGNEIEALLGTRDLAEIEGLYKWASGKKPYLYRLNQKPQQEDVRVLVLGVDGDVRLNINASGNIFNNRPARGVVRRKISMGNRGK